MNSSKNFLLGGLVKRLKDASISDCNTSTGHCVDRNGYRETTFSFNPIIYDSSSKPLDANRPIVEAWSKIVEKFEEKYTQIYIQSDMKKKAHLDCIEEGSNLIHEPKAKWCHVLLLDALVHSAHNRSFTALVESSVRRRKFNQHLELRNSILDVYGKSAVEGVTHSSHAIVSPDMLDRDLPRTMLRPLAVKNPVPLSSKFNVSEIYPEILDRDLPPSCFSLPMAVVADVPVTTKKNKKRKLSSHIRDGKGGNGEDHVEDANLLEDILSLLSDSPSASSTAVQFADITNRGSKKMSKTMASAIKVEGASFHPTRRPNQWESHEVFQEHLLSLAGTDKSSKRFQTVVYDLCGKLSADRGDKDLDSKTTIKIESKSSPSSYPSSPRHASNNLMALITAIIAKVCATPELVTIYENDQEPDQSSCPSVQESEPPSPAVTLPDFDFYKIESDLKEADYSTSTSDFTPHFYAHPRTEYNHRPKHDFQAIKIELAEYKPFKVPGPRSPYIIPAEYSENPESNADDNDNDGSCELGNDSECGAENEVGAKALPALLQCASDSRPTQHFLSFNEVWDIFSQSPNCL